jgi:putative ABC transport system permease protein
MRSLVQDLRFAVRSYLRTPGITLLAVVTLALGIGANAAIFSVIHNVLLAPLPYPSADRVLIAWRYNPKLGDVSVSPSIKDVENWRKAEGLEGIAAFANVPMVLASGEEPESLKGVRVDPGLFAFAGVKPAVGRLFNAEDAASEAAGRVVMLSDGLWRRRFGGDAGAIGLRVELDDKSYEIVGVLPASFRLPLTDVDVVVPLTPPPPPAKGARDVRTSVSVLVRLKPGVIPEVAASQMAGAGVEQVGLGTGWVVRLMRPSETSGPTFKRALYVLLGAVACVLLIACANVANIILGRNAARQREIAVRVAIGASRGRLVRQLLTENLVLAIAGGAAGLALGLSGVQAISALRPPQMRQLADLRIDADVFLFALAASILTGLAFGLLPAIAATRGRTAEALKQGARTAGSARSLGRRVLTVAEIALALVLLSGAGLLLRSYERLLSADMGFNPAGLLSLEIDLPQSRYPTPQAQGAFADDLLARVRGLPGVKQAMLTSGVPPAGGLIFGQLEIEGKPAANGVPAMFGGGFVQPGFFEALRIPVREGRTFQESDLKADSVIVNEAAAREYWPGQSAIGRKLRLGPRGDWSEVVGVVANLRVEHGQRGPQIYFPLVDAAAAPGVSLLVATSGDPRDMLAPVKAQARTIDPKLPVQEIETVEQAVSEAHARPRFNLVLLSVFAGLGLVLAMIGIYGVVSHSVSVRTQEIGVRLALGALPGDIRRGVLGEAVKLAAIGAAIGIAGALGAGRAMSSLLFEVTPNDPLTLAAVATLLAAIALLAAWLPARRAMRVDPMVALRAE